MTPGSDVDLLFLHQGDQLERTRRLVDAVLYPLWDSGLPVSHAVRTVAECRSEAAVRVESLTTLLDARLLAGSGELVDSARNAARQVVGSDPGAFLGALRQDREKRRRRFGSIGRMLEPHLKEGLGGLRDLQILHWLASLRREGPRLAVVGEPVPSSGPLGHLLLVRTALHRVSRSRSNRLLADHHDAVAEALAIRDRPDWEARDGLMRWVFGDARRVEDLTDRAVSVQSEPAEDEDAAGTGGLIGELMRTDVLTWLRKADAAGSMERLVPGWDGVRGRPQRDPYHRYPVDVHLIETVGEAARLLREPDEPFAVEAAAALESPVALLLGALLHDIGKIGRGSHVPTGVQVAGRALDSLSIGGDLRDDVLFLVEDHLVLSDTATRRNLQEEDLILHVAARIADERRLALLYLLTVADARATGPAASSHWRLGLVRELVGKVSQAFRRGLMDRDRAAGLGRAESELRRALVGSGRTEDEVGRFLAAMPPGYLLWVEPTDVAEHLKLISPRPGPAEVRMALRPGSTPGTYRVSLGAVDRLGFLAAVAGSMTLSGLSILGAQAFTTEDGLALDAFDVEGAFDEGIEAARWERFLSVIGEALEGRLDLRDRVHSLRAHYRPSAGVPVRVSVDQEASDYYTMVEVSAPDRLGLLFDLASVLSQHDLDVHVAKVATYGPRVLDVFYVRDAGGEKALDLDRAHRLEMALTGAASIG